MVSEYYFSNTVDQCSFFEESPFAGDNSSSWDCPSAYIKHNISGVTRGTVSYEESEHESQPSRRNSKPAPVSVTFTLLHDQIVSKDLLTNSSQELPDLDFATRQQFEEELLDSLQTETSQKRPAVRFLRIKKKTSPRAEQKITKFRIKHLEKRFSTRFHKDAKVLNKVRRTRLFWNQESQSIPNIFRVTGPCKGDDANIHEFLDFSRKEVLPDEVDDIPCAE